jgi:hypothetical protein
MPLTVLTGGQSGVDEGALEAVHEYRNMKRPIEQKLTVDWMAWLPSGYKRESPMPRFMREAKGSRVGELHTKEYDERTQHNVMLSHAVLLIEEPGKRTPGTKLTLGLAKKARGMQIWGFQNVANRAIHRAESHAIAYWLRSIESWVEGGKEVGITLMVAGPRISKWVNGKDVAASIMHTVIEAYERDIHVQPQRS